MSLETQVYVLRHYLRLFMCSKILPFKLSSLNAVLNLQNFIAIKCLEFKSGFVFMLVDLCLFSVKLLVVESLAVVVDYYLCNFILVSCILAEIIRSDSFYNSTSKCKF